MATVRIPQSAAPLLPFCKPWPGRTGNPCFTTYADLMIFAAGLGYSKLAGRHAPPCGAFLEDGQPVPIPFEVFKGSNLGLYPFVLLLSLASEKSHQAVRDEERLARTVENYANLGFTELTHRLAATTPEELHVELAQLLTESPT
jgi:hypothetical protein